MLELQASYQFISHCHLLYMLENCTVGIFALHFSCVR